MDIVPPKTETYFTVPPPIHKRPMGNITVLIVTICLSAIVSFGIFLLFTDLKGRILDETAPADDAEIEGHVPHTFDNAPNGQTEDIFDATTFLSAWNFNDLSPEERAKYYQETKNLDGTMTREYWFSAEDADIQVAPGMLFPAWTFNGQVPGPTIRATEGDHIKIHFKNNTKLTHTMHFHGYHDASMDGMNAQPVEPNDSFIYEFDAGPVGLALYHCHTEPLAIHIGRGMYGAYIIDPKHDTRPHADKEMVMLMDGFDFNDDEENEVYAVNGSAFYYERHPIMVEMGELVRVYVINITEFDPMNSFHLHANFFDEYPSGTHSTPDNYTDTIFLGQAERSILDIHFQFPGMYMFHAHQAEFTEKGWSGYFMVHDKNGLAPATTDGMNGIEMNDRGGMEM